MSNQKWLTEKEAKLMGFEPRPNEKGRNNARYRLNEEQTAFFNEFKMTPNKREMVETQIKRDKSGNVVSSIEKLQSEPIDIPEGFEIIKISTSETTGQQWVQYGPKKDNIISGYLSIRDEVISQMNKYSPKYPKIKYAKTEVSHCLMFDPADIHIGKISSSFETGEEYNDQIAVQRVMDGMKGIINKAKGFKIDKIIFVAGNDILHVDCPANTTTSGTRQDTTGMWYDSFLMAKGLLVDIIETLMQIAPVEVVFNPSNHDYMSGFFLLDSISSWFRLSKDVTFNCDMKHRKYTKYYDCLVATTHMDGAKQDLLPLLVAQESGMWDNTKHRYIFGHHIHHKIAKDYVGITLETLRSPSAADSWHHRKGFQHAPVAVEAFIFHKTQGEVCRITHNF